MPELTASSARITDENGLPTVDFRTLIQDMIAILNALGAESIDPPTGTGSTAAFDMNWTTVVSNPPTQGEMTSMRDQVIALQKSLGQLILDLQSAGVIS